MLKLMIKLGVPTVLICVVAAALLAGTYAVTKGPIEAQDKASREKALYVVMPSAKSFVEITDKAAVAAAAKASPDTPVDAMFAAVDGAGSRIGWVVLDRPRGYGGPMTVAVGLDRNGKVAGLNIVAHNETPGLGTKAVGVAGEAPTKFVESFSGVDSPEKALKLDGVTGATKSSRGVKHGVEAALLVYDQVLKGLQGGGS